MVALGGALGASLRYAVVAWAGRALGHGFPWGTAIVNVAGSFVMGLAAVLMMELGAGNAAPRARENFGGQQHAERGRREVDPQPLPKPR